MAAKKDDEPTKVVGKKGRYIGVSGRQFSAVGQTGSTITCIHGTVYEVGEDFAYMWTDPNYSSMWEWEK